MTKPKRIILTGKFRSGKSIAALHLVTYHGLSELAFGTKLKQVADELFDNSPYYPKTPHYRREFFTDEDVITGYSKPRKLYQDVGQIMRQLDENVWIRQVDEMMRIYEDSLSHKGVVVSDMRQLNEYQWARDNDFTVIRIAADDDIRFSRAEEKGDTFTEEDTKHETEEEVEYFDVDYEVTNNGDRGDLFRQLDAIMSELNYNGNGDVFHNVK